MLEVSDELQVHVHRHLLEVLGADVDPGPSQGGLDDGVLAPEVLNAYLVGEASDLPLVDVAEGVEVLVEEVMEMELTMQETRDRVREVLGKPLKWRLVPIRVEPEVYERLRQMAPDGDVAKLLKQAVERLLAGSEQ